MINRFVYKTIIELKHSWWDPKDGDLFVCMVKPEEILVEACSDTDVQIVRQTWV